MVKRLFILLPLVDFLKEILPQGPLVETAVNNFNGVALDFRFNMVLANGNKELYFLRKIVEPNKAEINEDS